MLTEDPDVFLREFGKPCSAGGHPFTALVDRPDQYLQMGGGQVHTTDWTLTVKSADVLAAGLVVGVVMTVDGSPGTVRDEPLALDDGAFFHVIFSR